MRILLPVLLVLSTLMFIGCSEPEVIYIDSNTGKPVQSTPKMETFKKEVVCNEFGMAYYKLQGTSFLDSGDDIYVPVTISYYRRDNSTDKNDAPFISCENYFKVLK